MRIDKYLSNLKYGTRSELNTLIKKGLVKVNGKVISTNKYKIDPKTDKIEFDNEEVVFHESINIMLNKPEGYLSANKDSMHKVVVDLIGDEFKRYDLKIAGRLDLNTSGLLILTTNGHTAHLLTSPNSKINKVYEALLDKDIEDYNKLLDGVLIKDGNNDEYLAKAVKIIRIEPYKFQITINEGKYHQVRRMFLSLNANVLKLKRIKYGKLELGSLEEGKYRLFSLEEIIWQI